MIRIVIYRIDKNEFILSEGAGEVEGRYREIDGLDGLVRFLVSRGEVLVRRSIGNWKIEVVVEERVV